MLPRTSRVPDTKICQIGKIRVPDLVLHSFVFRRLEGAKLESGQKRPLAKPVATDDGKRSAKAASPQGAPMSALRHFLAIAFIVPVAVSAQQYAVQSGDPGSANGTRMLRSPTVSANQIAFAYAQNIWIVD